jgi:DNA-binding XRE family transcriptional regulator
MNELFLVRLKEERKRLRLTQASAATQASVARETWSRYETGALTPGMEVLSALVVHGADAKYLLTGERTAPESLPLPPDEQMWLDCYRGWEMPVKRRELARALGLSPTGADPDTPHALTKGGSGEPYNIQNTGHHAVQIGSVGGKVSVKKER